MHAILYIICYGENTVEPYFSIVIPIHNEEENIPELYRRLTAVMGKLGSYEIIMVDDGSKDRSWKLIKELHNKDQGVKGISFSKNFGQHPAIMAGFSKASGQFIILMDADLQNPPGEIPKLVQEIKKGFDVVYGVG